MQISSRFTIATHILIIIALEGAEVKVTSDYLAGSVGVNPVVIRNILSQLKKADLVAVARGTGGTVLTQPSETITLCQVYQAVESLGKTGQLFGFHDKPNPDCQIGKNIHGLLDDKLLEAQAALENQLAQTILADLVAEAQQKMSEE